MIAWLTVAFGQQIPEVTTDAEFYRPSVDATRSLEVDDTRLVDGWATRLDLVYQNSPLVFNRGDGETFAVVRSAISLNVAAGGAVGPLRIGVVAPVYVSVTGADIFPRTVLGDPTIDLKLVVREGGDGFGFALSGGLDLPTGAHRYFLGGRSATGRVGAIADIDAGKLYVSANAGVEFTQLQDVWNTDTGSGIYARGVVGVEATESLAIGIEAVARVGVLPDSTANTPVELLLGVHPLPKPKRLAPHIGAGMGIGNGIGAPAFRLIAGAKFR